MALDAKAASLLVVLAGILGLSLVDLQAREMQRTGACAVRKVPTDNGPAETRFGKLLPHAGAGGFIATPLGHAPSSLLFAVCAGLALAALLDRRLAGTRSADGALPYVFLSAIPPLGILLRQSVEPLRQGAPLGSAPWLLALAWSSVLLIAACGSELSLQAWPRHAWTDARALIRSPRRAPFALLSLTLVGGLVWWQIGRIVPSPRSLSPSEFGSWFKSQPRVDLPVVAEGARVVVVKFNDYQCPPCLRTRLAHEPILSEYQARYPGAIKVVVKDYPLESECNPAVSHDLHPSACEAAVAVRLADRVGRRDAMEQWLFANQAQLTPDTIWKTLHALTGDTAPSDAEPIAQEQVRADAALGSRLGVSGTPTFFINGVRTGGLSAELFRAALDLELGTSAASRITTGRARVARTSHGGG